MKARIGALVLLTLALQGCVAFDSSSPLPELSLEARDQFRRELPNLILAASLIAVGIGAAALARLNWAAQGPQLLSFGVFSLLYGVRLAAWTPIARYLLDVPPEAWDYTESIITYFLPVVVLFFLEPFMGRFELVHWLWRLQLGYAIAATVFDLATESPFAAMGPYRILVMVWFGVALYLLFWRRDPPTKQLKIVRLGLLVFVVLAGHATLSGIDPLPGEMSAEPLGLLVFFLSLGYVVVDGFFSSQKELGALNRELETARRIQDAVLPRALPETRNLVLAVRYVPVSAVAGDFYDYLENERGLSLLVADVSGHGVPAALIASMVKVAYSAQSERVEEPSMVLSEINRILCGKIRGQFVTGGCLFIESSGVNVVYASAGHPPLVVVRADGTTFEQKIESVLMGFLAEADYRQTTVALEQGDKLILYTDGLVEAMNARGEFFGVERLLAFFGNSARDSAETLATGILEHVRSWSGTAFDDDVTLVVIERV